MAIKFSLSGLQNKFHSAKRKTNSKTSKTPLKTTKVSKFIGRPKVFLDIQSNKPNSPTAYVSATSYPISGRSRVSTNKTGPTTPLTPVTRCQKGELTTWEPFLFAHNEADRQRDNYLDLGHRHYKKLDIGTQADLRPNVAFLLPANNMRARLRFAKIVGEHLERLAANLPSDMPVFFVTLCRREHVMPLEKAAGFNVAKVVGWAHQVLRGAHYVGMVEGGFFSNLGDLLRTTPRLISWHAHLILWGLTKEEMAALRDDVNDRYRAVGGLDAAHFRLLRLEQIFGRGIYMCKGQVRDYRIWNCFEPSIDRITGEILKVPTGKHRVKKRPIRPGDAVRVCEVFADRTIPEFAFAAGEGRGVLHGIKSEALAELRRLEEIYPWRVQGEADRAVVAVHQERSSGRRPWRAAF